MTLPPLLFVVSPSTNFKFECNLQKASVFSSRFLTSTSGVSRSGCNPLQSKKRRTQQIGLFSTVGMDDISSTAHTTTEMPPSAFIGENGREFKLIPYGSALSIDETQGRAAISCDGRVPGDGVTLELTHWTDNVTPDDLYADTSTEMALNLAKTTSTTYTNEENLSRAFVVNNHFDTDGVLSSWICLFPSQALEYEELLKEGAEAGDFGEWSSDNGIKLEATLEGICAESSNEEEGYQRAFEELPTLLQDLTLNDGEQYKRYWEPTIEKAINDWNNILQGKVTIEVAPTTNEKIVILNPQSNHERISSHALHRGLIQHKIFDKCERVLRATPLSNLTTNGQLFHYEYEKVGHGWVQRLKKRPLIPNVNAQALVERLNNDSNTKGTSPAWKVGGSSGLVAICQTSEPIPDVPSDVAKRLFTIDHNLTS